MDICLLLNSYHFTLFEYDQRYRPAHNQMICLKLQAMIFVLDSKGFCAFKKTNLAFKVFTLTGIPKSWAKHISAQNRNYSKYQH